MGASDKRRALWKLPSYNLDSIGRSSRPLIAMKRRLNTAFTALLAAALFGATTPFAKTLLVRFRRSWSPVCSTLAVESVWRRQSSFSD
jgi:hypothetical protein